MITIRKYSEQDAQATWSLFLNSIRNVNINDYSQQQVEAWAPDAMDLFIWNKRMIDIEPFIAEIDAEIVGYADLQNDGYIDHFFCHYQYQGKGVGRALFTHIFDVAKKQKIKCFYSQVSITAKPFFEHFGFKVVKQQENEIRGQSLINFYMEKR